MKNPIHLSYFLIAPGIFSLLAFFLSAFTGDGRTAAMAFPMMLLFIWTGYILNIVSRRIEALERRIEKLEPAAKGE